MAFPTRVGLGSPAIDFSPRWGTQRRQTQPEDSTPTPSAHLDRGSVTSSSPGKTGTVLDGVSGLPSPPGTNSDIALPTPNLEIPHGPSLMNESPPPNLVPRDPLSRSSSLRSRPLVGRTPSMTSSASGSGHSEKRIRALRPVNRGGSPGSADRGRGSGHGMSRSISSSSANSPLRPKFKGTASPSTSVSRQASIERSRHSLSGSPTSQTSQHSSRAASQLRASTSSNGSRHHHSPSAPSMCSSPPKSTSPAKRHSGVYSPSLSTSSSKQGSSAGTPSKGKRVTSGSELDNRIREAEDKIRQAARRPRSAAHYPPTSPAKPPLARRDSYTRMEEPTRTQHTERDDHDLPRSLSKRSLAESPVEEVLEPGELSPVAEARERTWRHRAGLREQATAAHSHHTVNGHETLRRSATVGSASSMARTPRGLDLDTREEEQERSGGSGGSRHRKPLPNSFRTGPNSLFTPSPKSAQDYHSSPRLAHLASPTAPLSRFSTTSRIGREQSVPSPSSPSRVRSSIDGLDRASSVSSRMERRQWSESISGLPRRYGEEVDHRGMPVSRSDKRERSRADFSSDDSFANSRYSRDRELAPRLSRLSIAPGDSVSAVGAQSEYNTSTPNKDPLEVLKRIESQRNEHNRQWDAERSASVLGGDRPGSGSRIDMSPQRESRVRPATSMSSLRDQYHVPRTAPIDRVRRDFESSPLQRTSSRLSHLGPATEPRPMRSSTSLGGRSSASLDVHSASSEHGRLLYEAARSLDVKLPQDLHHSLPDIGRTFAAAARSAEGNNAAIRAALHLASQSCVDAEVDADPEKILHEFRGLLNLLREANRTSDQNVRDLTRIMLDVPKMVREAGRTEQLRPSSMSTSGSVRGYGGQQNGTHGTYDRGSPYASPVRRSEDLPRPSTSVGDFNSPDRRRARESLPPNFGSGEGRSFMSRMRNLGRSRDNLATIEDSPPKQMTEQIPPSPMSPARKTLRKKASSTSTHTVRGSSFMPLISRAPTTAISNVTVGDGSPVTEAFDRQSIRSMRSTRDSQDFATGSSPRSRMSFHTAEEPSVASSEAVGPDGDDDLLSGLVEAQRKREEEDGGQKNGSRGLGRSSSLASRGSNASRKWSVSDRFKATLKRG